MSRFLAPLNAIGTKIGEVGSKIGEAGTNVKEAFQAAGEKIKEVAEDAAVATGLKKSTSGGDLSAAHHRTGASSAANGANNAQAAVGQGGQEGEETPTATLGAIVELTPMMKKLNKEALQKARAFIAKRFADPMDLDESAVLNASLQKQAKAAATQLNGAVQGKLDALKRAADLMDESYEKLSVLSSSLKRIDERIERTNTAISNYEHLKRVHNVRENLQKAISQIEFFARVPERVRDLYAILEEDPARLKEVFLESLKLESLRRAMLAEIQSTARRSSVVSPSSSSGLNPGDVAFKLGEMVEQHLHIVPDLISTVRAVLFNNVDRLFEFSEPNAQKQDLVTTFEIIEMHQQYMDRKLEKARRSGEVDEGDLETSYAQIGYEPLAEETRAKIKQQMAALIEQIFTENAEKAARDKVHVASGIISATEQTLGQISDFRSELLECLPPNYEAFELFLDLLEELLVPEMEAIMKEVQQKQNADVGTILQLIDFFEFYENQMGAYEVLPRPLSTEKFRNFVTDLAMEYLEKMKTQLLGWWENIKKRELEVKHIGSLLVTSNPEDLMDSCRLQATIAGEKLKGTATHRDAIMAILSVFRTIQSETYNALEQSWGDLDGEILCTIINDNYRSIDHCDTFKNDFCDVRSFSTEDRELLCNIADDVADEYQRLAVCSVTFLAKVVLKDVEEEVFAKLFCDEWAKGEAVSCIITECFDGWNQNFTSQISNDFYCKLQMAYLVQVVEQYITTLAKQAEACESAGTPFRFSCDTLIVAGQIHEV